MSIRKLRAGRVPGVTANQYVGTHGTIFYDEVLGTLRISDGVTPYGNPLTLVGSDFNFTFGDFVASTPANGHATLSSSHTNQSIDVKSNGTGEINLTGQFNLYDAQGVFGDQPIFRVKGDGQIRMLVPLADSTTGALEIVGNTSGISFPPNQTGVILHATGNTGVVSRHYFDAVNNYVLVAGRRYNGTQPAPTRVLNNDIILRIVAQAAGQATTEDATFQTFGPARIDFVATEDQTPTAQGGEVRILATANGSVASSSNTLVATFNATTGVTATKFNGPLTGNVTGNVSGTAGSVAAANITGTTLASNVVTSSLTSVGTLASLSVTGDMTAGTIHGKLYRGVRDAGTIADGGTLTIDFSTDAIVHCVWGNGMTLAYQNYTAGAVVRVMAVKSTGTGTDSISLDGITASHVSTGNLTVSATADTTVFMEFTCTGTTLASLFLKV